MSDELNRKPVFVTSHNTDLDSEYVQWVQEIKERYRNVQIKAAVKVNSEQLMFNWQLGQDLVRRKAEERWGSGIVEQLSLDLQNEFPDAKGFSSRNLWNMKKWYLFYAENDGVSDILQTFNSLINTESEKLQQVAAEIHEKHGIKVDKLWLVVGVIVLVQCTAPLIEYVLVENGLKRKFDENGNIRK